MVPDSFLEVGVLKINKAWYMKRIVINEPLVLGTTEVIDFNWNCKNFLPKCFLLFFFSHEYYTVKNCVTIKANVPIWASEQELWINQSYCESYRLSPLLVLIKRSQRFNLWFQGKIHEEKMQTIFSKFVRI